MHMKKICFFLLPRYTYSVHYYLQFSVSMGKGLGTNSPADTQVLLCANRSWVPKHFELGTGSLAHRLLGGWTAHPPATPTTTPSHRSIRWCRIKVNSGGGGMGLPAWPAGTGESWVGCRVGGMWGLGWPCSPGMSGRKAVRPLPVRLLPTEVRPDHGGRAGSRSAQGRAPTCPALGTFANSLGWCGDQVPAGEARQPFHAQEPLLGLLLPSSPAARPGCQEGIRPSSSPRKPCRGPEHGG